MLEGGRGSHYRLEGGRGSRYMLEGGRGSRYMLEGGRGSRYMLEGVRGSHCLVTIAINPLFKSGCGLLTCSSVQQHLSCLDVMVS